MSVLKQTGTHYAEEQYCCSYNKVILCKGFVVCPMTEERVTFEAVCEATE